MILGLDVATVMGVCLYNDKTNYARVTQYKADPIEQFQRLENEILQYYAYRELTVLMELPVHFRNADVTRKLLTRYGYIKYTLLSKWEVDVVELNLNSVRHYLGVRNKRETKNLLNTKYRGKKFTDNHSDSLALCLFFCPPINIDTLTIGDL